MTKKVRWILNDEIEFSDYKTKKRALKEYKRLIGIDYKYKTSLRLIRHDILSDTYAEVNLMGVSK